MLRVSNTPTTGDISLLVMRGNPFGAQHPASLLNVWRHGLPHFGLPSEVNRWRVKNLPNLWRGLWRARAARALNISHVCGAVFLRKNSGGININGKIIGGVWTEYGMASLRVVTDAGVAFLAGCFDNTNEPELFKFHGFGIGTGAEAVGDTALGTEFTTEYAVNNTRPTGSQAHATNTYTTVATFSPDSGGTLAVTEHGVFSQAATGGGTLWDRSKFAAVNLAAAVDSLQVTYVATFASGG